MKINFKNLLITTAISSLITSTAIAGSLKEFQPYVGMDYQRTMFDYNNNWGCPR